MNRLHIDPGVMYTRKYFRIQCEIFQKEHESAGVRGTADTVSAISAVALAVFWKSLMHLRKFPENFPNNQQCLKHSLMRYWLGLRQCWCCIRAVADLARALGGVSDTADDGSVVAGHLWCRNNNFLKNQQCLKHVQGQISGVSDSAKTNESTLIQDKNNFFSNSPLILKRYYCKENVYCDHINSRATESTKNRTM